MLHCTLRLHWTERRQNLEKKPKEIEANKYSKVSSFVSYGATSTSQASFVRAHTTVLAIELN